MVAKSRSRFFLSLSLCHNRVLRAALKGGGRRGRYRECREYRELGTGTGAVHIVRLLPVFLRILVYFFFLLLLLFPGANYDSTTQLQAKRLGQEVMHMSGSLGVRRKICQWQNAAKATTVRQAGSIPSCCMQIFPAHTAKLCCQSPLQLFSHPPTPFQSCTCATPLLELTSSIFRIFCNTIFILYLRIFLPSLSLCFSLYPSRCTSSFVVVVVVAAGNRKP